jgi:hypothetical protein
MSKKANNSTTEKTKIVLEEIKAEMRIAQISCCGSLYLTLLIPTIFTKY